MKHASSGRPVAGRGRGRGREKVGAGRDGVRARMPERTEGGEGEGRRAELRFRTRTGDSKGRRSDFESVSSRTPASGSPFGQIFSVKQRAKRYGEHGKSAQPVRSPNGSRLQHFGIRCPHGGDQVPRKSREQPGSDPFRYAPSRGKDGNSSPSFLGFIRDQTNAGGKESAPNTEAYRRQRRQSGKSQAFG